MRKALLFCTLCLVMAAARVKAIVIPSFIPSTTEVCSGVPMTFLNTTFTTPGRYRYYWYLSYGTPFSANTFDPGAVAFYGPGAPIIRLEVFDSSTLMTYYYEQSIRVLGLPSANINSTPTTAALNCLADSVILRGTTTDTGHIRYLWTRPSGLTDTSRIISAHVAGSYNVIVTNSRGCTSSAAYVYVNGGTPITAQIGLTTSFGGILSYDDSVDICSADNRGLQANAGGYWPFTYEWSTGSTSTNVTSIPTSGNYWVKVTDGNGCIGRDTIHINRNVTPPDTIGRSTSSTLCAGDTLVLTAAPGFTYNWSTYSGTVSTARSIVVTNSSYYNLAVSGLGGCIANATYAASFNPSPIPDMGVSSALSVTHGVVDTFSVCANAMGSIYGYPSSYSTRFSYRWSVGTDTVNTTLVRGTGLYRLTVTNAEGCTASKAIYVIVNAQPDSTYTLSNTGTLCTGTTQAVRLRRALGNTYEWSTGSHADSVLMTSSGTVDVTITNARGCLNHASYSAIFNTTPSPSIVSGPCSAVISSIVPGNRYQWFTSTGVAIPGATSPFYGATTGGFYTVRETSPAGCVATAATSITCSVIGSGTSSDSVHSYFAQSTSLLCGAGTVNFTNLTTAILPTRVTSTWAFAGGTPSSSTLRNPSGIRFGPGLHTVTLVSRDTVNGSSSTFSTEIFVDSLRISAYGFSPTSGITRTDTLRICRNYVATIGVVLYAGTVSRYTWNTSDTVAHFDARSSAMYSVHVIDDHGCTADDSVYLVVNANPDSLITRSSILPVCLGDTLRLSVPSGNSYLWNDGSTNRTLNVVSAGIYSVTITSTNGCVSHASASASFNPVPMVALNVIPVRFYSSGVLDTAHVCGNNAPSISGSPSGSGYTYRWNTGSPSSGFPVPMSGVYTASVTNTFGCMGTKTVYVAVHDAPDSTLTLSRTHLCTGDTLTLSVPSGNLYSWNIPGGGFIREVTTSGTYSVTITNVMGCVSHAATTVVFNALPTLTLGVSPTTGYTSGLGTDTAHVCGNRSAFVTASASTGSSFRWEDGSSFSNISALNGLHTVTVTSVGCSATASVYTLVHAAPDSSIVASSSRLCDGDTLLLHNDQQNSYVWSDGSTGSSLRVFANGTYSVTVTNAFGCVSHSSPYSAIFHESPSPAITAFECLMSVTPMNSGSSYQWFAGSNAIPGATSGTHTATASSFYSVRETNLYGCGNNALPVYDTACSEDTIVVTPPIDSCKAFPLATPQIIADAATCELACSITYPATSFMWYRDGVQIPSSDTQYISSSIKGFYQVKVFARGCDATSAIVAAECVSDSVSLNGMALAYPNPFRGQITVMGTGSNPYVVIVTDILGQQVLKTLGKKSMVLNTMDWIKGVYILNIYDRANGNVRTEKMVKD